MKLIILAAAALGLASCGENEPKVTPKYRLGQMVKMKAFGTEGMVVYGGCWKDSGCTYSIRFSSLQLRTDTRLFGKDGPIDFAPISIVHHVREFEIIPSGTSPS